MDGCIGELVDGWMGEWMNRERDYCSFQVT